MHLEMFSLSFRHEMTTEIDFSLFPSLWWSSLSSVIVVVASF